MWRHRGQSADRYIKIYLLVVANLSLNEVDATLVVSIVISRATEKDYKEHAIQSIGDTEDSAEVNINPNLSIEENNNKTTLSEQLSDSHSYRHLIEQTQASLLELNPMGFRL